MSLSGLALVGSLLLLGGTAALRGRLRLSATTALAAVWIAVIALPATIRYWGLESATRERFWWATVIVNLVLAAAAAVRWSEGGHRVEAAVRPPGGTGSAPRPWSGWMWAALALSVGIFLVHASQMPRIPLVELVVNSRLSANQLTELREEAGKLLGLPLLVQYVINWNVRVLVPIILCALVLSARRGWMAVGAVLMVTLAALTLEKSLPAFAILAAGLGVAVFRRRLIISRPVVLAFVLALLAVTALQTAVKLRDIQVHNGPQAEQPSAPAPGEVGTSRGPGIIWYPFQFVYHRVLKIPSEVAFAWFDYFPEISGGFLEGASWWPGARSRPGFQHPANLVGRYYYHERDPEHYLASIHAYAAFHADAWANFGYPGVVIASLGAAVLLLLVDLAIASADTPVTAGAAGAAFSILLTTLPSGGLQAAIIAQGLLPALLMALLPFWGRKRRR